MLAASPSTRATWTGRPRCTTTATGASRSSVSGSSSAICEGVEDVARRALEVVQRAVEPPARQVAHLGRQVVRGLRMLGRAARRRDVGQLVVARAQAELGLAERRVG